jgi:deoxyadenosine/deoxycytidine kinase
MDLNVQIVSIEGNIGSGKSTLLANLKKDLDKNSRVIFLKEPVDEWNKIKDENGVTILEKFYGDQNKYSFPFQMMAYISRLKLLKDIMLTIKHSQDEFKRKQPNDTLPKYTIITERSLFTDKMVFAKMLYDSKKIEHVNYQIYLNWFDTFAEEFVINKIIYIKADPETCHQRITIRNRDGENNIPVEYLKSCSEYHDNMLNTNLSDCVCKEQLLLDGNQDIYKDTHLLHEWIESIKTFIYN